MDSLPLKGQCWGCMVGAESLGEPERRWESCGGEGPCAQETPNSGEKVLFQVRGSHSDTTLSMPLGPQPQPAWGLPSWASTASPSKHTMTFYIIATSSREERGSIPSAPPPRLQTHCAGFIFSKKRAFPLQHALCGKLCFLLTSGTNSVWHVWRGCSPEPLPC